MNKNKQYSSIIVIIIAVLLLTWFLTRDEGVSFSEPKWNCVNSNNKWKCKVSFEVINETHTQQVRKVSIRRVKTSAKGKMSIRFQGERTFDLVLAPKQHMEFTENLMFDYIPESIKVHVWK